MRAYKILVTPNSDYCIKVLKFINSLIKNLNRLGIRIIIKKINKDEFTKEFVKKLELKGIRHLPAMIDGTGKVYDDSELIINLFSRLLSNQKMDEIVDNNDIHSYMYDAMTGGNAKDDDEDDSKIVKDEIEKKLKEYNNKRPKHRSEVTILNQPEKLQGNEQSTIEDNVDNAESDEYLSQLMDKIGGSDY